MVPTLATATARADWGVTRRLFQRRELAGITCDIACVEDHSGPDGAGVAGEVERQRNNYTL